MHTRRVTRNHFLEECAWLYAQVAFLAFLSKSFVGSNLNGLSIASLTVRMLPRVSSGSMLGRKGVLFFRTIEKTLSSAALECGIHKISRAIFPNLGNFNVPSTHFSLPM